MVSVPLRVPSAVGLKVMLTEHLDFGPIVAPHALSIAKSPSATMLENVTGVVLLLFAIVIFLGLLTAPSPNTTLPSLPAWGETLSATGTVVAVGVAVGVNVAVGVDVAVAVAVRVGVADETGVRTAEGVPVGVGVEVAVAVAVAVDEAVAVAVAV